MNFRGRIAARRRRRRREKAARANRAAPLREFVYLDDMSVFSLLASRIGPIATEFTDSESRSLSGEVRGKVGASAGIVSAGSSSRVSSSTSSSSQVVRKSIVESSFKELHGYVRHALAIGEEDAAAKIPTSIDFQHLDKFSAQHPELVVPFERLQRGELIELEVELSADDTFRMGAIFAELMSFLDDAPQLESEVEGIDDAISGGKILDRLLAGLVPIRGRAVNYAVLDSGGMGYVVHADLIPQAKSAGLDVRELMIVGVAETEFFWRDLRRVLFNNSSFTVLSRVSRTGVNSDWTPVKLLDIIGDFAPDLKVSIDSLPEMLQPTEPDLLTPGEGQVATMLLAFAYGLAAHFGKSIDPDWLKAQVLGMEPLPDEGDFVEIRMLFSRLSSVLAEHLGFEVHRDLVAELRSEILTDHATAADQATSSQKHAATASRQFLDCEFVAIYW